jgi:hypothetical protein
MYIVVKSNIKNQQPMTIPKLTLLCCLFAAPVSSNAQKIGSINFDTTACGHKERSLKITDKKVLTALSGAEKYIQSILGNKIVANNIWFDCFQSRETAVGIFSTDFKQPQRLGEDTCYEFYYFVKDNEDFIGDFQLFVDKNGNPKQDDSYPDFNQPQLINGFKKHFLNHFKFNYEKAWQIGKKKGFTMKPLLTCSVENKFVSNANKEEFVKVKYNWSFFMLYKGGAQGILEINAETGQVEKEQYIPAMPK